MILPIVAYGSTVLKKKTKDLSNDHPNVKQLIENMWETMYASNGVGLAAPQIGLSLRLFVVDTAPFADDEALDIVDVKILESFKKVFINPTIIEEDGEIWEFNEGCLSIPDIREDVSRHERIKMNYLDEYFKPQTIILSGLVARVVQHEYDHIEGILFTDKLSSFKKKLLSGKLKNISFGKVKCDYPMQYLK